MVAELTSNQIVHNALKAGWPSRLQHSLPADGRAGRSCSTRAGRLRLHHGRRLEWVKFESGSPAAVRDEYLMWRDERHTRLHLDHVPVIDEDHLAVDYAADIGEAIGLGYNSVMVDASRLDLAGNIAATKQITEMAHAAGIACEAELGAVMGTRMAPFCLRRVVRVGQGLHRGGQGRALRARYEVRLALGRHRQRARAISAGLKDQKKVAARLNLEHLDKLRQATGIPLVLHGGSGIRQEYVLEAIKRGIAKLNIATEIRQSYEQALRETGDVEKARTAVYDRTCWLLTDYFKLAGIRAQVTCE